MTELTPEGVRFSLLYMRPDELTNDSPRLRERLRVLLENSLRRGPDDFGRHLRSILGVNVQRQFQAGGVNWDVLQRGPFRDMLDSVTIIGQHLQATDALKAQAFAANLNKILVEEAASYRVDKAFGVHPNIDKAYLAGLDSAVGSLQAANFASARESIQKADDSLLPAGNTREAIRAIFDAVENIFKQHFKGVTHINNAAIKANLEPLVKAHFAEGIEQRSALKLVASLTSWIEACHFYRHDDGKPDPTPPQRELAIALVAQGISHTRWLGALLSAQSSA